MTNIFRFTENRHFIFFLFTTILFLGYERHIYEAAYPYVNIIAIFLLIAYLVFSADSKVVSFDEKAFIPLGLIFIATIFASLSCATRLMLSVDYEIAEIYKSLMMFVIVVSIIFYIKKEDTERILSYAFAGCATICIVNIFVFSVSNQRLNSFFNDPNYFAAIVGFSILYSITIWKKQWYIKAPIIAILFYNLFLTYSKGSLIALALSLMWLLMRRSLFLAILMTIPLIVVLPLIIDEIIRIASNIDLLRVHMGLNRRDIYWSYAFEKMLEHPFRGYGYNNVVDSIKNMGYENASFHNYYIDSAYINGIPFLIAVLAIIGHSIFISVKKYPQISVLLIFLAINANSFSFSIGGVGFISFIFSILTLYPYQYGKSKYENEFKVHPETKTVFKSFPLPRNHSKK